MEHKPIGDPHALHVALIDLRKRVGVDIFKP